MADITYSRAFKHEDWVDNEDVVQAGGEKGFNQKFHAIEGEFDRLTPVVSVIDKEIKKIRVSLATPQDTITLDGGGAKEVSVETYDRSALPDAIEKVYFAVIFLSSSGAEPTRIHHTFFYQPLPNSKMKVSVTFFNAGNARVSFNFRILTLGTFA